MFINFSNHPSAQWPASQTQAASAYGEITDIPFPAVPVDATSDDISATAEEYAGYIIGLNPEAVMCQGEFTLAYAVISRLKACGIKVVAACTERKTVESIESGVSQKISIFEFRGFREYADSGWVYP